jgi:serine/threonine protein kinase
VQALHEKAEICHLDLKLENILIDDNFDLKICDFGFSQSHTQLVVSNKGTDGYKAPEIYNNVK